LRQLIANIDDARVPLGLVSQYVGDMLIERSEAAMSQRVIADKVGAVVNRYRRACAK
jgi:tagatose-1,6-bisphosphate aldolase non-catalytic subunit AgaZ/GatZ